MAFLRIRPWQIVAFLALAGAGFTWLGNPRGHIEEIYINLGTGLLCSVVIFLILEQYLEYLRKANGKEVRGFDYRAFVRNVRRSERVVRILGTFIYPFTSDPGYREIKEALEDALREAIRKNPDVIIQLLFLQPTSFAARQRAEERKDDRVIERIWETLAELRRLKDDPRSGELFRKVEVKLYDRSAAIAFFQTDNLASMLFYLRNRRVSEVNRFTFFTDTPLGIYIERTFEDLWVDEKTVSLEDYSDRPS